MSNIEKLLRPNGTVLLLFLISNPIYDIYERLSKIEKYQEYMSDVNDFISPYHKQHDPLNAFRKYVKIAGLKERHIEVRERVFLYKNTDQLLSDFNSNSSLISKL